MRTIAERTCLLAVALTVFGSTSSAGAEDAPYGVRATPLKLPEHLQHLGSPLPPPSEAGTAKTHTFFLNYDGGQVTAGFDDNSATNTSMFQEFAGNYAPYGGGAKRAASMQAVITDWAPYDVVITDTRPNGVYTMCINTPTNPFGGGVLGIAPLDCNDSNGANIVFAFHSDSDEFPAATQATTMSQEIAHAFGLEHVSQPNDIMNPYNAGGDPKFLDQCLALDGGNIGIQCGQQHQQFCGGNQQNSHQELLWLFGASTPDSEPPTVQITFPVNGQVYKPGEITNITANASDNQSVVSVDLLADGNLLQTDNGAPWEWAVNGIPPANYCFTATAKDTSGNLGNSDPVCITVEEEAPPDPSTSTSSTSSDTGNDDSGSGSASMSGDDGAEETGFEPTTNGLPDDGDGGGVGTNGLPGLPPDYGQDDEGGCRVAPPLPTASLLVLALVGLGRRRRR